MIATIVLNSNSQKIQLTLPYISDKEKFLDLIADIKQIQDRKWNADAKKWEFNEEQLQNVQEVLLYHQISAKIDTLAANPMLPQNQASSYINHQSAQNRFFGLEDRSVNAQFQQQQQQPNQDMSTFGRRNSFYSNRQ